MPGPVNEARCRGVLDHHQREPDLSVRQLAKIHGLSSSMVHRILSGKRPVFADGGGEGEVVQLKAVPAGTEAVDRSKLTRIEDLELRVRELDELAHNASRAQIYGPAVAAKAAAAKLRRELAELEAAQPPDDDLTADDVADGILALADDLVPVARAALERREREGRR
jgi:predicted transcriptional regulator